MMGSGNRTCGWLQSTPARDGVDARFDDAVDDLGDRLAVEVDHLHAEDLQHRAGVEVRQAVADDRVHRDEQHELEHEGQAARRRVDASILVQRHRGFADLRAIALVATLQLLDLRLQELHPALRHRLAAEQRDHRRPDDQRQDDDRDRDVAGERVEERQHDEQDLEHRREEPRGQADRVRARAGGDQGRRAGDWVCRLAPGDVPGVVAQAPRTRTTNASSPTTPIQRRRVARDVTNRLPDQRTGS